MTDKADLSTRTVLHHRVRVSVAGLQPVGRRLALGAYLRELSRYRAFIAFEARSRLLTANRGMILGNAWLVGRPLIDGATYFLFFGVILQASRGMANYPGFLLIGVFLFAFTASSMRAGAGAMIGGRNLLRAFAFPRAVVPLSLALREALNQLPQLATLAVMLMVLPPHALPRMSWLLFPLVVLLAGLFNAGLLLFLARLTAHVPDLTVVVGMITAPSFMTASMRSQSSTWLPSMRMTGSPLRTPWAVSQAATRSERTARASKVGSRLEPSSSTMTRAVRSLPRAMASNQSMAQLKRSPTSGKVNSATARSWCSRSPMSWSRAAQKASKAGEGAAGASRVLMPQAQWTQDVGATTPAAILRPISPRFGA